MKMQKKILLSITETMLLDDGVYGSSFDTVINFAIKDSNQKYYIKTIHDSFDIISQKSRKKI